MGLERLKNYLLSNPKSDLLLLDLKSLLLGSEALEAGTCIGEDLIPSTFLDNPAKHVLDLDTQEAGLVKSKEDSKTPSV